ncbi:hypothetical protein U9M48_016440 [Paspalum notatum var. saurae]|uniref:RNase H type-1 domain-containing protein n=1 Tax=Paspalum notatum var. saurae TaxID=547442 RepID=A0AAQ3T6K9_PASNO
MGLEQVREKLLRASNAREMICMILNLPSDAQGKTLGLLWAWWEARNKANVGEDMKRTEDIVHRAVLIMADPPTTNENKETTTPDRHRHWVNPPPDKLKINCDGAFAKESKQGAWGFVIRDHEGNGVLAGAGKLQDVPNAMCAEGYACLAALEAAMNAGMAHIILETDSLCLVSALKTGSYDYSIGGE